jgi:subtilase family serine protease
MLGCRDPSCVAVRAILKKAISDLENGKVRVTDLERVVNAQKDKIQDLEEAKNEAIDRIGIITAEVRDIYTSYVIICIAFLRLRHTKLIFWRNARIVKGQKEIWRSCA